MGPQPKYVQHLQDGKDNVQAVGDVEGGEDVVEAVAPHVLAHLFIVGIHLFCTIEKIQNDCRCII